ncbi:MAG: fumarate reductase/succinate dehydrogenase flavoprotein domain protein [Firmicutes bacterium]|nr:fumarate reductase/succinate dehydrogenase flavoprotein domain protein [Bacillota bacterium]
MKKWRCTVCGYIHVGAEPPEKCPMCGAPKEKFELLTDDAPASDGSGKPKAVSEVVFNYDADVLVVGSGAAALSADHHCKEQGRDSADV